MPHAAVRITAGAVQTEAPALNQAGISSCSLIRLKPDPQGLILPEKLGGWARFYSASLVSLARALWAWEDTNANKWLAVGIQSQTLGANAGQALSDLTNLRQFLTGSALFAFFDAPWFPIYLIVIFLFEPSLGVFSLVGTIVLIALSYVNEIVSQPCPVAN